MTRPKHRPRGAAPTPEDTLPALQLVTADELAAILRVSKRTVFRLRARGDLPAPVEVTTNVVRWRMADVRAYLASLSERKPRRRR